MQQNNNKRIIVITAIVGVCIVLVVLLSRNVSLTPDPGPSGNSSAGENKPAQTGSSFTGYDKLLTVGVTVNQVAALQTALQRYKPLGTSGTAIDMSQGSLTPYAPSLRDPLYRPSIGTSVLVNQKTTYKIRFYYWGTASVELLIYDSTGKTKLFDSGTVTASS